LIVIAYDRTLENIKYLKSNVVKKETGYPKDGDQNKILNLQPNKFKSLIITPWFDRTSDRDIL